MYAILNQTEDADRNDESPVLEFLSAQQQRQRDEWEAETARLSAKFAAARDAHVDAARRWAAAFPARPEWVAPRPVEARSAAEALVTLDDEGRVKVAPGQAKDTTTVEIAAEAGVPFTAFRLESLPDVNLPGGGAGGAGGNFVVTRVRAAVRPAAPHRNARFIRVELPGKGRVLSFAEVEVLSGGRNVAPSGVPTQSSVAGEAGPARAIDERKDGAPAAGSLVQTETGDDPWWELDLGAEIPVERVVLWARLGEEATPGGLRVTLLDAARKSVHESTLRDAHTRGYYCVLADDAVASHTPEALYRLVEAYLTLGLLDPYSRQPAFKQCSVKIEPAPDQRAAAAANAAARSF